MARCPECGFAMIVSRESGPVRCSNPFHPRHPGPCPNGHRGPMEKATLGPSKEILCRTCGAVWTPSDAS